MCISIGSRVRGLLQQSRWNGLLGLLAIPLALGFSAQAQPPAEPVEEFSPTAFAASSWPRLFFADSDRLFFSAWDRIHGRELWVTDGTLAGTRLVRDVAPGQANSDPFGLVQLDESRILFFATDVHNRIEPWVSDGTAAGTRMLADFCLGTCGGVADAVPLGDGRALLLVTPDEAFQGFDLWVTDGTPEGTTPLLTPEPDEFPQPQQLMASAGRAYVVMKAQEGSGPFNSFELWISDGTSAGTRPLTDLGDARIDQLMPFQEGVAFRVLRDGEAAEIWTSEGAPANTRLFMDFADLDPSAVHWEWRWTATDDRGGIFFSVVEDLQTCSIWYVDGTQLGSRRFLDVTAVAPLPDFPDASTLACPSSLFYGANRLFFRYEQAGLNGRELWVTDGSAAGTQTLIELGDGDSDGETSLLTSYSGLVYFLGQRVDTSGPERQIYDGLWSSDGTPAGTTRLARFEGRGAVSSSFRLPMLEFKDQLISPGVGSASGVELWRTDGTIPGTRLWQNLAPDPSGTSVEEMVSSGDRLFLVASEATDLGDEYGLWVSDGTAAGTSRVALSGETFAEDRPRLLTPTDSSLFYIQRESELWATDGVAGDARRVGSVDAGSDLQLTALGDRVCYRFETNFWCSDGTAEGTGVLRAQGETLRGPGVIFRRGDKLWVSSSLGSDGRSYGIWETDGTAEGTRFLSEINGTVEGPQVGERTVVGDEAYFLTSDDSFSGPFLVGRLAQDPWRFETVATLGEFEGSFFHSQQTAFRGRFAFFLMFRSHIHLGISDGSQAGTRILRSFEIPLSLDRYDPQMTVVGNDLYFVVGTPEHGQELWATDGTAEGTRLVRDIEPGAASSNPHSLKAVGSVLLFSAGMAEEGVELWRSDGTEEGTRVVEEINPGSRSSDPRHLTLLGDDVYFTAWRDDLGSYLWRLDASDLKSRTCVPRPGRLCLGDDRYEVLLDWRDPRSGELGRAEAQPYSGDTGHFWFFNEENLELMVKILDGGPVNGYGWVFYGSLTDLAFWLSAVDLETGLSNTYVQRERETCGGADVRAFPLDGSLSDLSPPVPVAGPTALISRTQPPRYLAAPTTGACTPDATTLCLLDGRFQLSLEWSDQRRPGRTGDGMAVEGTDQAGYFWFFQPSNLELMVKVLDGRPVNGNFWVFYGSLTDVEFTMTVTDTMTGAETIYHNEPGNICGRTDTAAF
ncbi:MAG: hypothetical protein SX243_17920 [Acidobacteriota bacterium]|nr:hypothetical protein [Acidobacteriota bacterium]